ncbi:N-acetylmuramoyl-L-alanine amidase [Flavobacterium sp. DGU38]|uniref:N-acetylmuramoyl-L-alanine amidase n=1 Tax=Flavobacterium calami TaxID=3139144 RepID=A0ABU9IN61_9FLAO
MKTKTRILGVLAVLGLFVILAFKPLNDKKVIVIDAGHGGHDFGATLGGFEEKALVEKISKKIKALNKDENIEIVLLRDGDHFMELSERVSIINNLKADLVVSLHVNTSKDSKKRGFEVYVSNKNEQFKEASTLKAKKLLSTISNQSLAKGEVKEAPFYIMKNSNCPAVLIELGYLSNENDRNYITSEIGQNELAAQILESVK